MELGYPTAMFLGVALCLPTERVFVIEGDGSMLAGLSVLTTIARYRPRNLVVIVVDNHAYVTTGSLPSATANANGTDLVAMAKGAGIEKCISSDRSRRVRAMHETLDRRRRSLLHRRRC